MNGVIKSFETLGLAAVKAADQMLIMGTVLEELRRKASQPKRKPLIHNGKAYRR